jgi:hypothetical protein
VPGQHRYRRETIGVARGRDGVRERVLERIERA